MSSMRLGRIRLLAPFAIALLLALLLGPGSATVSFSSNGQGNLVFSRLMDINTETANAGPENLVNVGGTVYFRASDGASGSELWKSDGTEAGTVLLKDINPGSASSGPSGFTAVGGSVFFSANDGISGVELWKSDGTPAGTVLVKDIRPGVGASSIPSNLTNFGGGGAVL